VTDCDTAETQSVYCVSYLDMCIISAYEMCFVTILFSLCVYIAHI